MRKDVCCNVYGKSFFEIEDLTRQLLTHKEARHKIMKCDLCDYSIDGITSFTHLKIHYTPEKNHLTVPKVAKGAETNFININIIRPPAKTK